MGLYKRAISFQYLKSLYGVQVPYPLFCKLCIYEILVTIFRESDFQEMSVNCSL